MLDDLNRSSFSPLVLDAKGAERMGYAFAGMLVVAFTAYVINSYAEQSRRLAAKSAFLRKAIEAGIDMATLAVFEQMENPAAEALRRIVAGEIDEVLASRLRQAIAAGI
jgi:hypothetical protein